MSVFMIQIFMMDDSNCITDNIYNNYSCATGDDKKCDNDFVTYCIAVATVMQDHENKTNDKNNTSD